MGEKYFFELVHKHWKHVVSSSIDSAMSQLVDFLKFLKFEVYLCERNENKMLCA